MSKNEALTLLVAAASLIVAIVSAVFAGQSVRTSKRQLALIERKIGMVTDPTKMTELMPIWYVNRMSQDYWGFGLLLASGELLGIERIIGVSDDRQWLEVELLDGSVGPKELGGLPITYTALPDRTRGSVRVDLVQAAFELWTS
jgi:hypothetical protein